MTSTSFVELEQEQMFRDLLEIVSWNTVRVPSDDEFPYGAPIHAALDKLVDKVRAMGFTRLHRQGDHYMWVEIGDESRPLVAAISHLDTVSFVPNQWEHNPLGDEDATHLYGRGVVDDKCSIVQVLYALKYIEHLHQDYRIRLIVGCDEETDCRCMKKYIEMGEEMPRYGIIPDAKFPYIRSEKGLINVTFQLAKSSLGSKLAHMQGGICGNVIPNSAWMEHAGTIIKYQGISSHSADYSVGENAIIKMFEDLARDTNSLVSTWMRYFHAEAATLIVPIGTREIAFNPTFIEDVGEYVNLTFDSRIPIELDAAKTLAQVMRLLEIPSDALVRKHIGNGYVYSDDHPVIQVVQHAYRSYCHKHCPDKEDAEPLDIAGTTYAKYFPNCISFGPGFPLEHSYGHREDERLSKTSFTGATIIYIDALVALARMCAQ